jgi:hypothetical protein
MVLKIKPEIQNQKIDPNIALFFAEQNAAYSRLPARAESVALLIPDASQKILTLKSLIFVYESDYEFLDAARVAEQITDVKLRTENLGRYCFTNAFLSKSYL